MTKLYTMENGKLIPVETPGNLDIAAAKLTNDPAYNALISNDMEQTKGALTYVMVFALLPLILVFNGTLEKYGLMGPVVGFVYLVFGYFLLRNIWLYGIFYVASLAVYFKWFY